MAAPTAMDSGSRPGQVPGLNARVQRRPHAALKKIPAVTRRCVDVGDGRAATRVPLPAVWSTFTDAGGVTTSITGGRAKRGGGGGGGMREELAQPGVQSGAVRHAIAVPQVTTQLIGRRRSLTPRPADAASNETVCAKLSEAPRIWAKSGSNGNKPALIMSKHHR